MWSVTIPSNVLLLGVILPLALIVCLGLADRAPFLVARDPERRHLSAAMILCGSIALGIAISFLVMAPQ